MYAQASKVKAGKEPPWIIAPSGKPHDGRTRVVAGAKRAADAGRSKGRLRRFLQRHRGENLKGRDIYYIILSEKSLLMKHSNKIKL